MRFLWEKLSNLILKAPKFLIISIVTTGLVLFVWLATSTAQEEPEVGFEFEASQTLNLTTIVNIDYGGECPGTKAGTRWARFISSEIPTAPGRRVIVRNVSRGVEDDPYPYTDREYSKGRSAQPTVVTFGTRHSGRNLKVLEGENKFEYQIKEKDFVVGQGTFTAQIESETRRERRNAVCQEERYCAKSKVPLDKCEYRDIRTREKCTCPI